MSASGRLPLFPPQAVVVGAPATLRGRHALVFVIEADDGSAKARVDSTFFGPM